MKIKIIAIALICTLGLSCFGLSGCATDKSNSNTTENSFVSKYASKYDFYDDSVKTLKRNMSLSDEEVDNVFGVLVDNCVDDKISYCFDETDSDDNDYYEIWWGLSSCDVYLKDNAVSKIIFNSSVIYEDGKKIKATEEPTTEEPTTVAPTTEKPTEKVTEAPTEIVITSITSSVNAGETASVSIQGAPNTEYYITVTYKSGKSTAAGLEAKTSDSNGNVSWSWEVGAKTSSGTYPISISGGGTSAKTEFTIN